MYILAKTYLHIYIYICTYISYIYICLSSIPIRRPEKKEKAAAKDQLDEEEPQEQWTEEQWIAYLEEK